MGDKSAKDTWVRIALVLMGVFAAVLAVEQLNPVVNVLAQVPTDGWETSMMWTILGVLVAPIALLICSFVLIRYCHSLAIVVTRPARNKVVPYWEQAAYRLGSTICGILVISWALPRAGQIGFSMAWRQDPEVSAYLRPDVERSIWISLVYMGLQTLIGVYLLWGAPHLVKWQLRRIALSVGGNGTEQLEEPEDGVNRVEG